MHICAYMRVVNYVYENGCIHLAIRIHKSYIERDMYAYMSKCLCVCARIDAAPTARMYRRVQRARALSSLLLYRMHNDLLHVYMRAIAIVRRVYA